MKEIWKDIKGYKGIYQISNLGRVKSLDRIHIDKTGRKQYDKGKTKSLTKSNTGYLHTSVSKDGQNKTKRL